MSRSTALDVAQVNIAPHALLDLFLMYLRRKGPNRSTPVAVNVGECTLTRSCGRLPISVECGGSRTLLQVTQFFAKSLAIRLPPRIQYFVLDLHRVLSRPACFTFVWALFMMSDEMLWCFGRRTGFTCL